jgi:hypothetical protein
MRIFQNIRKWFGVSAPAHTLGDELYVQERDRNIDAGADWCSHCGKWWPKERMWYGRHKYALTLGFNVENTCCVSCMDRSKEDVMIHDIVAPYIWVRTYGDGRTKMIRAQE